MANSNYNDLNESWQDEIDSRFLNNYSENNDAENRYEDIMNRDNNDINEESERNNSEHQKNTNRDEKSINTSSSLAMPPTSNFEDPMNQSKENTIKLNILFYK